jgi:UPF0489 domain
MIYLPSLAVARSFGVIVTVEQRDRILESGRVSVRVLNLDLDFFLNDRATMRADTAKARPKDLTPWEPERVLNFLQNTLNLRCKVPGRIVRSHDEVFYRWRDLIQRRALTIPFFVAHVDAHSDLGMGTPSWVYLHSEFLELPLTRRARPKRGVWGLNFASYMPFAIGNCWFSEIDFITPRCWHDDILRTILADDCPVPNGAREEFYRPNISLPIELMHATNAQIDQTISQMSDFSTVRRKIGEPRISLNIVSDDCVGARYSGQLWDYVFLSRSPGYTPKSADSLIPIIAQYIDESAVQRLTMPKRRAKP